MTAPKQYLCSPLRRVRTSASIYELKQKQCLDGGGVRGLSSLLILRSILYEFQKKKDLKVLPRPCDVFDVIAGTSTGG